MPLKEGNRLVDREWRMSHLYKIVDKNSKLIVFKRNAVQTRFNSEKHTRNIILKARQEGFTTNACIEILDEALFSRNFNGVIIAHDHESLKKIFKKIKRAWDEFDPKLKSTLGLKAETDAANQLSFNTGSTISVSLSSRSDTVSRLHVSEFGKICAKYPQKAEEIITGAFESVVPGGRIDVESTAEGEFGEYYDMFWNAWGREPKNDMEFKAHFFSWTENSEYETTLEVELTEKDRAYQLTHGISDGKMKWYALKRNNMPSNVRHLMPQEYPTTPAEAFVSSGQKLFPTEALEWQKQFFTAGTRIGDWTVYEQYNPKYTYALGADVAEGVGRDSSTAVLLNITLSRVAAIYASNSIEPDLFGHELFNYSNKYGGCIIAPERNNCGLTTVTKLKELGAHIYTEEETSSGNSNTTKRLGWRTTSTSKPLMMFELKDAIMDKTLKVLSEPVYKELRSYDPDNLRQVRFDPDQTRHWDLVIALAIAWQMRLHVGGSGAALPRFHFNQHGTITTQQRPTNMFG